MRGIDETLVECIAKIAYEKKITPSKEHIDDIFSELDKEVFEKFRNDILTGARESYFYEQTTSKDFLKRNFERWENGFVALGTHISLCIEVGKEYNNEYRKAASSENDYVFEVIISNHAKACLISNEIYCLLINGYPDAANARWRSLHECSVVSNFILENGQECAEKYLRHKCVDIYKEMVSTIKYAARINRMPPSKEQFDECKEIYDNLIAKYGKQYSSDYGWAADYLNGEKPIFSNIERTTKLDHWRPYYKEASQYIHPTSYGIAPKIALEECESEILLVGRSNSGMVEPAHGAAISLAIVTSHILLKYSSISSSLLQGIVLKSAENVGEKFFEIFNNVN